MISAFIICAAVELFRLLRTLRRVFNIRRPILASLLRLLLCLAGARWELLLLLELVFLLILRIRILPKFLGLLLVVAQNHVVAHIHHYFFGVASFLTTAVAVTSAIGAGGSLGLSLHLKRKLSWRAFMIWACWHLLPKYLEHIKCLSLLILVISSKKLLMCLLGITLLFPLTIAGVTSSRW